jgi:hypothetical protein
MSRCCKADAISRWCKAMRQRVRKEKERGGNRERAREKKYRTRCYAVSR